MVYVGYSNLSDVEYHGFVILDHTFEKDLSNPSSQKFKSLASKMIDGLENIFCDADFENCSLKITGFRNGSVITDFSVTVKMAFGQESNIMDNLNFKMIGVPSMIDGIGIGKGNFTLSE